MSGELFLIYWAIGVAVFTSQLATHWWMVDMIFDMLDKEHGEESPPVLRMIAIVPSPSAVAMRATQAASGTIG